MLTFEDILQIITDDQLPYWILFEKHQYSAPQQVGRFLGETLIDDKDIPKSIEHSTEALKRRVTMWKVPTIFRIELSKAKTSNQGGKSSFEFKFIPETQQTALSGFSEHEFSLGKDYYNQYLEVQKMREPLLIERVTLEFEKKQLEEDRRNFEDEVKQIQAEIDEQKKQASNIFKENIPEYISIGREILEGLGFLKQNNSVGGTPEPDIPNLQLGKMIVKQFNDNNLTESEINSIMQGIEYAIETLISKRKKNNG